MRNREFQEFEGKPKFNRDKIMIMACLFNHLWKYKIKRLNFKKKKKKDSNNIRNLNSFSNIFSKLLEGICLKSPYILGGPNLLKPIS